MGVPGNPGGRTTEKELAMVTDMPGRFVATVMLPKSTITVVIAHKDKFDKMLLEVRARRHNKRCYLHIS